MKIKIKTKIKYFSFLCISFFIFFFLCNAQIINALSMNNYQNEKITEELRLRVPSDFKEVWLSAEKKIWEPWLNIQNGFIGRQIFWNKEKEEALILVNWENKKLWKSISMNEVNEIQERFEENVKKSLNLKENPFILIYEGELDKQE